MVSSAKVVVAQEKPNARQTDGGKPLPIVYDTTLAIIEDMKGTLFFSGIPGAAIESAIVAVSRQNDDNCKDPFNLLGFDALTGSQTRSWGMFEAACSSGGAHVDGAEATETQLNIKEYNKAEYQLAWEHEKETNNIEGSEAAYNKEATAAKKSGKFIDAATKVLTLLSEKHPIV